MEIYVCTGRAPLRPKNVFAELRSIERDNVFRVVAVFGRGVALRS